MLRAILALCLGLALLGPFSHAYAQGSPTPGGGASVASLGPLHTAGAKLIDAQGLEVRITGVNWFGLETETYAPHGLWARNYGDMLDQMVAAGFNTVRLPFSNQLFDSASKPQGIDFRKNPDLQGLTGLQIMDRIVAAAGQRGLSVILDRHRPTANSQSELWYTKDVPETRWIQDWVMLARHYAGNPTVIAADLHNEPHGPATWGDGNQGTDWRAAAERAGNAILGVNPDWLIIVEGIEHNGNDWYWWGGNLAGARNAPVRLSAADKLVYSSHDYGPGVYQQAWFRASNFPANLPGVWHDHWAYLEQDGTAPVLVGEFGGRSVGTDVEGVWQRSLLDFLKNNGLSYTYWAWNPDSGDTGGILDDDWSTLDQRKLAMLAGYQSPVDAQAAAPTGTQATPPATAEAAQPASPAPADAAQPALPATTDAAQPASPATADSSQPLAAAPAAPDAAASADSTSAQPAAASDPSAASASPVAASEPSAGSAPAVAASDSAATSASPAAAGTSDAASAQPVAAGATGSTPAQPVAASDPAAASAPPVAAGAPDSSSAPAVAASDPSAASAPAVSASDSAAASAMPAAAGAPDSTSAQPVAAGASGSTSAPPLAAGAPDNSSAPAVAASGPSAASASPVAAGAPDSSSAPPAAAGAPDGSSAQPTASVAAGSAPAGTAGGTSAQPVAAGAPAAGSAPPAVVSGPAPVAVPVALPVAPVAGFAVGGPFDPDLQHALQGIGGPNDPDALHRQARERDERRYLATYGKPWQYAAYVTGAG